jgi:murein L,D-transpeptidase YcbB/YkuD
VFDAAVTEAVKKFQQANNLDADGLAGPATMSALGI